MEEHGKGPRVVEPAFEMNFGEWAAEDERRRLVLQAVLGELRPRFRLDLRANVDAGVVAGIEILDDRDPAAECPTADVDESAVDGELVRFEEMDLECALLLPEVRRADELVPSCLARREPAPELSLNPFEQRLAHCAETSRSAERRHLACVPCLELVPVSGYTNDRASVIARVHERRTSAVARTSGCATRDDAPSDPVRVPREDGDAGVESAPLDREQDAVDVDEDRDVLRRRAQPGGPSGGGHTDAPACVASAQSRCRRPRRRTRALRRGRRSAPRTRGARTATFR